MAVTEIKTTVTVILKIAYTSHPCQSSLSALSDPPEVMAHP